MSTCTADIKIEAGQKFTTPTCGNSWIVLNVYRDLQRGQVVSIQCQTCISREPFVMDLIKFQLNLRKQIFVLDTP